MPPDVQNLEIEAESRQVQGWIMLVFNAQSRLLLPDLDGAGKIPIHECADTLAPGESLQQEVEAHVQTLPVEGRPRFMTVLPLSIEGAMADYALYFLRTESSTPASYATLTLERAYEEADAKSGILPEWFDQLVPSLKEHSIELPYLDFRSHDFVYKFRSEGQRNRSIYRMDPMAQALYQSRLCEAIKATRRTKENASDRPARLDFGPVVYYLPSHFGFCLGVQNAIERAYETLAENPERRVFMLSELIHNPFVNEDLKRRGLRFLQTDKGEPLPDPESGKLLWDLLQPEDIVVIPAFGATLEDKRRLIEKGLEINRYDATCMLVEKVWKAAKRYGEAGFTVIIHGKREHEETKATFSSSARFGPCLVIRNQEEAEQVAEIIRMSDPEAQRRRFHELNLQTSGAFDPARDLQKIAVVNQTTLLRNETLRIIGVFEKAMADRFGAENLSAHLNGKSRGDTLCYATQVNQDSLALALQEPIDFALVAGGKNSSNTFQLYRICRDHFGDRACYIQSEENIQSPDCVLHYHFPYEKNDPKAGSTEPRSFLNSLNKAEGERAHVLLTGGASCPDGIIQQIISRINRFFPPEALRPLEDIIREIEAS